MGHPNLDEFYLIKKINKKPLWQRRKFSTTTPTQLDIDSATLNMKESENVDKPQYPVVQIDDLIFQCVKIILNFPLIFLLFNKHFLRNTD